MDILFDTEVSVEPGDYPAPVLDTDCPIERFMNGLMEEMRTAPDAYARLDFHNFIQL